MHAQSFRRRLAAPALALAVALGAGGPATGQSAFETPVVEFQIERFEVTGDNPLPADRTAEILAPFTGKHAGVDGLLAAADALDAEIRKAGHGFRKVVLRPQQLDSGVVTLDVVAFTVSGVSIRGNEFYGDDNIRRTVPALREGEVPDTRAIRRSLAVANRQPTKNVALTFRESETDPTGLDADLKVDDAKPWTVFASFDNTGSSSTGPTRITGGASVTNIMDADQTASFSYTTSPGHPGSVKQWAGSYTVPLYRFGGVASGYVVHSAVDTGRLLDTFDVTGSGTFAGLRYTHELGRRGKLSHRVSLSLDDKKFDNDVVAAGTNFATDVRSRPVGIRWDGEWAGDGFGATANVGYVRNTGFGGGNDTASYTANRAGARKQWDAVRGGATFTWPMFEKWTGRAVVDGQWANQALIPGEQYGLGGAYSVRGFSEREVSGDNGARVSMELWSPPWNASNLRFVLFVDAGRVDYKGTPPAGSNSHEDLASTGFGARWGFRQHFSFSLDFGKVLTGPPTRENGGRGHLNVLWRY